jgi:hypothetical protein
MITGNSCGPPAGSDENDVARGGLVPGDRRGPFLTPYRKAMVTMLEDDQLTHLDRALLAWLVFAVDPGTRRLEGVTIASLAETHHTGRNQMAASLERLRSAGYISYRFVRHSSGGWVELRVYDRLMAWTEWLAEQRKKAQVSRATRARMNGQYAPLRRESPGKTPESFLILSN